MGKKSDRRERRIAAAQDRDFMVNAATCWVYVATAMRYRDDAAFAEAMRQEKRKSLRAAQHDRRPIHSLDPSSTG